MSEGSRPNRTRRFLQTAIVDFGSSDLLTDASAIAFCLLFAAVPFGLFAVALVGFLGFEPVWTVQVAPSLRTTLGDPLFAVVDGSVRQVLAAREGFWLTLGLALAVWELAAAVRAIATALNRVYCIDDERSSKRWILTSIALALAVGALILVAGAAIFFGGQITEMLFGPSAIAAVVGFVARWAVALGAMVLAVGLLLRFAPGERVDWRWVGTGALVTVAIWAVASIGFEVYVTGVANYGSVYGGLTVPFVLLLYVWVTTVAFTFGVWFERRQRKGVDYPLNTPPDESVED